MQAMLLEKDHYQSVKKLIYSICHRFRKKYGGDWEELESEANYYYVLACKGWDEKKGKFSTHLTWKVWFGLLDMVRERARKSKRIEQLDFRKMATRIHFDVNQFHMELSKDAVTVAKMAVGDFGNVDGRKWEITKVLLDLGWSGKRIAKAFKEIGEALQ